MQEQCNLRMDLYSSPHVSAYATHLQQPSQIFAQTVCIAIKKNYKHLWTFGIKEGAHVFQDGCHPHKSTLKKHS